MKSAVARLAPRAAIGVPLTVAMLMAASYVMLADFVNLRRAVEAESPTHPQTLPLPQPWGGYGWRRLARLAGDAAALAPDTAGDTLLEAAVRYPVDAQQWLDLARIHARRGNATRVDALLTNANAVQPFERRTLWAASQVALQTGNAQLAERQLRHWLRMYPRDTGQALFIGRRWIDRPGDLLDRMLPEGREYLAEAMEVARMQRDADLAEAVWQRLEPRPGLDDVLLLNFVELLLADGQVDRAVELWAERDDTFEPGRLANGSFSRPLGEPLGLNWRIGRLPAGIRVARDTEQTLSAPASLKIEFNGKENIHLGAPWIRIPVQPGRHYRLSGSWRAEGLTTRSLPYLYLAAEQGDLRERRGVPGGNFGWEPWAIEFQAPQDTRLVRLQLRRDRTEAFDRNIDGALWLDDFRLESVTEPQTLQSAISEALGRNTVSGFRFPVSGEKPRVTAQIAGAGLAGDGATSGVGGASSPDPGRPSAQDAPPTASQAGNQPTSRPATGVGAGLAGDGAGAGVGGASSPDPGRPSAQDAPPTTKVTAPAPADGLEPSARKPETGNPKPGPEVR